ncbi:hypothetical protein DL93DRAFT_2114496, partial [Clavulina sp. PMI_390]
MVSFLYPSAIEDASHISYGAQCAKVSRHSLCTSCTCQGLHPQPDWQAVADDSDDADEVLAAAAESGDLLTDEGFLNTCACGHGAEDHGCDCDPEEFARKAALAVQIDSILYANGRLLDFNYHSPEVFLLKQQMKPSDPLAGLGELQNVIPIFVWRLLSWTNVDASS